MKRLWICIVLAALLPLAGLAEDAPFSDRDLRQTVDMESAVAITLTGDGAQCGSDAVTIDGSCVTIGAEGVYVLSGVLADGQVVVQAGEADKVQLVLAGADIACADSAALLSLAADKVFLTLAEGTQNRLANGGAFAGEDGVDAAVFSRTDLTMNGAGSLTVDSPAGHGVVSKDELTVTGGSYAVTAAAHGLCGKDGVAIAAGSFAVVCGKDGIHAEHSENAEKGNLYIAGGSFTLDAQGDALSASGTLQIDGGSFALTTGGGSASVTMSSGDMMMGRGGFRDFTQPAAQTDAATQSSKGIKAAGAIAIAGGEFALDTADDAVHGGADVRIAGGTWSIRTGDDAIHADGAASIEGGEFDIPYCYEGVEGTSVTVTGGTLAITAHDDGLNAAGGADASGWSFGFGRQDEFAAVDGCEIVISGGSITIVSSGDCIDSNGSLTVSGGTLDLTCNGNGNTAIDANGAFTHTGGEITTNDGSENGGMGGRGGMGGKGGSRKGMPRP